VRSISVSALPFEPGARLINTRLQPGALQHGTLEPFQQFSPAEKTASAVAEI